MKWFGRCVAQSVDECDQMCAQDKERKRERSRYVRRQHWMKPTALHIYYQMVLSFNSHLSRVYIFLLKKRFFRLFLLCSLRFSLFFIASVSFQRSFLDLSILLHGCCLSYSTSFCQSVLYWNDFCVVWFYFGRIEYWRRFSAFIAIPFGATHVSNLSYSYVFCWMKLNVQFVQCSKHPAFEFPTFRLDHWYSSSLFRGYLCFVLFVLFFCFIHHFVFVYSNFHIN